MEDLLPALRSRTRRKVEGGRLKVVWKINTFRQALLYRTITLVLGVQSCLSFTNWMLLRPKNWLGALTLARSIIETAAVAFEFQRKLRRAVDERSIGLLDEVVMQFCFATKLPKFVQNEKPATSVLTQITNMDNAFFKGKPEELTIMHNYAWLCEYAHPNYLGMLGLFRVDKRDGRNVYFSLRTKEPASLLSFVESGVHMAHFVHAMHDAVEILMPDVTVICEADLQAMLSKQSETEVEK